MMDGNSLLISMIRTKIGNGTGGLVQQNPNAVLTTYEISISGANEPGGWWLDHLLGCPGDGREDRSHHAQFQCIEHLVLRVKGNTR